jgi:hypothetical protein
MPGSCLFSIPSDIKEHRRPIILKTHQCYTTYKAMYECIEAMPIVGGVVGSSHNSSRRKLYVYHTIVCIIWSSNLAFDCLCCKANPEPCIIIDLMSCFVVRMMALK